MHGAGIEASNAIYSINTSPGVAGLCHYTPSALSIPPPPPPTTTGDTSVATQLQGNRANTS